MASYQEAKYTQVSRFTTETKRGRYVDIGYIIIPSDVSRQQYINDCKNKGVVSVLTESSKVLHNVFVTEQIFKSLKFPNTKKELGSCLVLINHLRTNKYIALGTLLTEDLVLNSFEEGTEDILLQSKESLISQSFDSRTGDIYTEVQGKHPNIGGNIRYKIRNKNGGGQYKIDVDGQISLIADEQIDISSKIGFNLVVSNDEEGENKSALFRYVLGDGLSYEDEFNNFSSISEDGNYNESQNFTFKPFDYEEIKDLTGAVLGKVCKEFLDSFIQRVSEITTTTAMGQMPILNKIDVEALKDETEKIISKYFIIG